MKSLTPIFLKSSISHPPFCGMAKTKTPTAVIVLFLLLFGSMLFGQEDMNTGIIYGDSHAFSLTAPNGWILDNNSGVSQGLYAVFYKKGESWEKAATIMYVNTASLEDEAHRTLEQLIKFDTDNFKSNYPDIVVTNDKDIAIKGDVIAQVKYLSGKSYGNYEAMAYIEAGKIGIMIILSSRTRQGFDDSLIAFEQLVKSYWFITEKVKIENSNDKRDKKTRGN